ncbi:MAG: DEAD/DEAH box helicase [Verrucomicrobiaceae bacterium]
MASSQQLVRFFRDCLREERSRSGIPNLFASRILSRRFITGPEKATAHEFATLDLMPSVKDPIVNYAQLRGRNSQLLYATLPITGQIDGRTIAAPLLLYPVIIDDNDLRLQLDEVRINPALTSLFQLSPSANNDLLGLIPDGSLNTVSPTILAKELQRFLPDLDLSPLHPFPELLGSKSVKDASQRKTPSILPASALVLVDRANNAAGLLQELDQLSQMDEESFPPPLQALLGKTYPERPNSAHRGNAESIPALLSAAQLNLLNAINSFPLSVCQGPPGTGKTFSLAASATEQILRGQSVLIACRSDEAADVLHQKLKALVPDSRLIVRAGRRGHLKSLKSKVEQLLSTTSIPPQPTSEPSIDPLIKELYRLESDIRLNIRNALSNGDLFHTPPESWWKKARKWLHLIQLKKQPLLASAMGLFYKLHDSRLTHAHSLNKSLHKKLLRHALNHATTVSTLQAYRKALRHRFASKQEAALQAIDPSALFRVLPVWITTTDDLHRILPFKPGLFDLAIIDEATQCDLPSALPLLYRAKRALVAGDPKQLRHLSFISTEKHHSLAKAHQLSPSDQETFNYRDVSLIDRALDQTIGTSACSFLNEHFRSLPSLIRFSNDTFYNSSLHLMRDTETLLPRPNPLHIHRLPGTRDHQGINLSEITAAVQICAAASGNTTLGFLSPFRAQVDAFLHTLQSTLTPDLVSTLIHTHKLIAGTSHSFQGDERDHMIISLALDNNSPEGARRFAEREDVFNVAITRSRERMDILHSFDPAPLPTDSLLRKYLHHRINPTTTTPPPKKTSLGDLTNTLSAIGWKQIAKTSLAGVPIDLLIERDGQLIAIDLIATPGEEGAAVSLSKSLLLQRSGVALYPLRIDEWLHRKNEVIEFFNHLPA